jgi:integrase
MQVRLKHLYRSRDRHGNLRIYFRRGPRKIRIREPIGSPEFLAVYNSLLAASGDQPVRPGAKLGTLRWLVHEYTRSSRYVQLDPRTQRVRQLILESACAEPTAPGSVLQFGDVAVAHVTSKAVRILRDRKRDKPQGSRNRLKALRSMYRWAIEEELLDGLEDPTDGVPYLQTNPGGWHSWTPEEVEQFEAHHGIGTKARLAMALLLYTGQRRSDVVLFGRQHVREGWLRFTQQKGRNRKPITLQLPVLAALQSIIDATPSHGLTFLLTDYSQPFTANGFGNKFRAWCNEAGLPHCSAHGLRKAGAVRAAENGASAHQLCSVFGWLSLKQAEHYTRAAEQKRLARDAMPLLMRNGTKTESDSPPRAE